jgi:hypothetical protein
MAHLDWPINKQTKMSPRTKEEKEKAVIQEFTFRFDFRSQVVG